MTKQKIIEYFEKLSKETYRPTLTSLANYTIKFEEIVGDTIMMRKCKCCNIF